jgi:hypothetical protein
MSDLASNPQAIREPVIPSEFISRRWSTPDPSLSIVFVVVVR